MEIKKIVRSMLPYAIYNSRYCKPQYYDVASLEPDIYSKDGYKKRTFYLKDKVCHHSPYTFSSIDYPNTTYINWDRYNYNLPIHFYSHEYMFEEKYNCKRKFGIIVESEAIDKYTYKMCRENSGVFREFDAVFTHSEFLLDKYENALFIPGSSLWYGGKMGGGVLDENAFYKKNKMISLVSSDKEMCELHKYRKKIAKWGLDSGKVDVMGTINGASIKIADSLKDYRYSIAIENNITSCYFTEKLLNCFASMTVPIYCGATGIEKFFNEDGIIRLEPDCDEKELDDIIKQCSIEDYENRKAAILENYKRCLEYNCLEDYIYKHYSSLF